MELHNGRVALALHTLQAGEGLPLLLLHELGGSAADFREGLLLHSLGVPGRSAATPAQSWPGPVHALDLSGHGCSGRVYGGGYYPELWAADADIALASLGEAVVLGSGLGAYVALLLAGGRPDQVRCAVLGPGAGLEGGGATPIKPPEGMPDVPTVARNHELLASPETDPTALAAQHLHTRPPDYALRFARAARQLVLIEDGEPRPPWWCAVRDAATVQTVRGSREALPAALALARDAAKREAPAR